MDTVIVIIGMVAAGFVVGIFSGMLGVGGGTIIVPLLRLVFGLEALAATATSLFTIVFTSVSGAVSHLRNKTCVWQLGIAMGIGGALTSVLGVWLANISPSWAIILAATAVIVYSAFSMFKKALAAPKRGQEPKSQSPAGPCNEESLSICPRTIVIGVLIGMVAGVASGYVGVGGGFIMVPLMLSVLKVPMKKASGTSLVGIMILAIPGVIEQCLLGNVDYLAGICLVVGSMPGASVGAALSKRIPERTLRFVFAFFLVAAGALLLFREIAA